MRLCATLAFRNVLLSKVIHHRRDSMPLTMRLLLALPFGLFLIAPTRGDALSQRFFMAAMHPSQLHALSSTSYRSDTSSPRAAPSPSSSPRLPLADFSHPIIFIPTFQDTLLHHCTSRACRPVHLAPLNPRSYPRCYAALQSTWTKLLPDQPYLVEHPSVTCPPSPFSHQTHCNPVPAAGPVQQLRLSLTTQSSSPTRTPPTFRAIPYDWRRPFRELLRPGHHFATSLQNFLSPPAASPVVIAHATACRLMHAAFRSLPSLRPALLICLAPPSSKAATASILRGQGILTAGGLHTYAHPLSTASKSSPRNSYAAVAHELGLSRSRRSAQTFPDDGPWQSMSRLPIVNSSILVRLASSFPALRDLASPISPFFDKCFRTICVEALLELADNGGPSACAQFSPETTLYANASAYDLVSLLAAVGKKAVGDDLLQGGKS